MQFAKSKVTIPVTGFGEATFAVSVKVEPGATLALDAVSVVVVGAGAAPPLPPPLPLLLLLPPPHPIAKLSRDTSPSPRIARRERPSPGNISKSNAAKPASPPKVHHSSRPREISPGARTWTGAVMALRVLDGGRVLIVNVAVVGALLLSVTEAGEILHVAPGIELPCQQLSCTVLV